MVFELVVVSIEICADKKSWQTSKSKSKKDFSSWVLRIVMRLTKKTTAFSVKYDFFSEIWRWTVVFIVLAPKLNLSARTDYKKLVKSEAEMMPDYLKEIAKI